LSGIILLFPGGIISESDIQSPVQLILHAPVRSDGMINVSGVSFKARQMISSLLVDLSGHDITGAGFYSHYAFKSDPSVFVDDVVEVGYDRAGSCLLPSMV
jgi:hypothetical protein